MNTFTANIYCGLKEGYKGKEFSIDDVKLICRRFCDDEKLAVTVTPTNFVYVNGGESGVIVGLINYPRFPSTQEKIRDMAKKLATTLMKELCQNRVSIVFSDETIMLENEKQYE